MKATAGVVVIGGGVMGTSTAFRLAQRGLSVILVEKSLLAGGSSGKSSAGEWMRDAKIVQVYQGTSQIRRPVISRWLKP